MIKWIKNDFKSVREGLSDMTGKEIPLGIALLYYVTVGVLLLPFEIMGVIVWKIWIKKSMKSE